MNLFLLLLQSFFQLQNEQSLDQQIDYWFGKATSWFVDLIFYQIPIKDEVSPFWVMIPPIFAALFFTIYFYFFAWLATASISFLISSASPRK